MVNDRLRRARRLRSDADASRCSSAAGQRIPGAAPTKASQYHEAAKGSGCDFYCRYFRDSRNIIPEKVTFTVDFRDIDLARRNALEEQLLALINSACLDHGLTYTIRESDTRSDPRYCASGLRALMQEQATVMGLAPPELMSGPFHDSLTMSYVCDYGIICLSAKTGSATIRRICLEDIALGTDSFYPYGPAKCANLAGRPEIYGNIVSL